MSIWFLFSSRNFFRPSPHTHTHSTKQSAFGKCLHVARKLSGRDILYSCRLPCVPLTLMMLLVEGSRRCRRSAGGEESTVFKSRIHRLPAWLTNIINFLCFFLLYFYAFRCYAILLPSILAMHFAELFTFNWKSDPPVSSTIDFLRCVCVFVFSLDIPRKQMPRREWSREPQCVCVYVYVGSFIRPSACLPE